MTLNLRFEVKPNSQACVCFKCRKPIGKGRLRFTLAGEAWKASGRKYYHPGCFLREIKILMKISKRQDKWLAGVNLGIRLMGEVEQ